MAKGHLKIQAHTADDAFPIRNTKVLVKDLFGRILYNLKTDTDGNTEYVELDAPDKSYNLSSTAPPPYYGLYDVEIRNDKFITEEIKDVQIFDSIDSFLPINLLPNPTPETEVINVNYIPENKLHSSELRDPEGMTDIPNFTYERENTNIGYTVLREVIVPDYINVKLGTPTSTARIVKVKFNDYVKNVASSEIYPDWPSNSLIANIHAIITFALNRIYTEWYRSRGYTFDITNSTKYDMMFVENRNIFQNISNIVDEIFNVYGKRIGFKDPYFTEFCNGTTSKCSGMSQWGTVAFANQGLNPLQILRSYYPKDLELVRTNNIGGVTESYPGRPLSQGNSGNNVQTMQYYLNRIRINYPAIPVISNPNGYFGADTTNAVRAFQRTFNLIEDGIIGRGTWYKIVQIYVGITKLAELTSEGQRMGIGENPPTLTIREGSKGPDVTQLQFILNFISKYYNDIPSTIQDSVFGRETRDSVIAFQRDFDLTQDGIVGPNTWEMLYQVYGNVENNNI